MNKRQASLASVLASSFPEWREREEVREMVRGSRLMNYNTSCNSITHRGPGGLVLQVEKVGERTCCQQVGEINRPGRQGSS